MLHATAGHAVTGPVGSAIRGGWIRASLLGAAASLALLIAAAPAFALATASSAASSAGATSKKGNAGAAGATGTADATGTAGAAGGAGGKRIDVDDDGDAEDPAPAAVAASNGGTRPSIVIPAANRTPTSASGVTTATVKTVPANGPGSSPGGAAAVGGAHTPDEAGGAAGSAGSTDAAGSGGPAGLTGSSGSSGSSGSAGSPGSAGKAAGGKKILPAVGAKGLRIPLEAGIEARMGADGQMWIEVAPRRGEAFNSLTQRMCGDSRLVPQLMEANHLHAGARALTGKSYQVPYEMLSAPWQLRLARAVFPEDHGDATGWRHQARGVGVLRRENLWQLSEWFTGKGENYRAIREYNGLHDEDVAQGALLTIPSELLRPAFGAALPVPQKPFVLDYGKDQDGEYAIYRLRPGEALYSGVVVRFTGRIYAADVNALAADIAHRSGIDDVTAIPVGFKVKIPLGLLQPEFLPDGDPRRKEYEAGLRASSQFSNQVRARGLEGITVIVDAGHGGHDSGATMGGVWESLYVYDIALRLKRLLEKRTAAAVQLTTRDGEDFRIADADVLPTSRRHSVMTNPPYPIEDPVVGVNLRWYLANSFFRRALTADNDPQKVVFLSVHADSLHPSLRGAMAYIPAARMRDESYGKHGAVYEAREEYRENPRVEFPLSQRVKSEGLSRELAKQIIGALEGGGLPVHPFTPVRDHIIRNGGEWVPAVLRYNSVPAKMLLEVCNLNNDLDRRLLQTRAYREHVAEAVLEGLLAYYGQTATVPALRVARAAGR